MFGAMCTISVIQARRTTRANAATTPDGPRLEPEAPARDDTPGNASGPRSDPGPLAFRALPTPWSR
jgi:hypothetical protein